MTISTDAGIVIIHSGFSTGGAEPRSLILKIVAEALAARSYLLILWLSQAGHRSSRIISSTCILAFFFTNNITFDNHIAFDLLAFNAFLACNIVELLSL